ncbi:hypothetical protein CEXT_491931 [Caerostris extrusa]|uniref:Uncharacterized protein n=1 Tax=Caerostris extrusa TaxID=172846 RepID=A0AAV4VNS3_CAEEX|nr:hypothetical protein CEXT_491931 [Caerostris extrusa]
MRCFEFYGGNSDLKLQFRPGTFLLLHPYHAAAEGRGDVHPLLPGRHAEDRLRARLRGLGLPQERVQGHVPEEPAQGGPGDRDGRQVAFTRWEDIFSETSRSLFHTKKTRRSSQHKETNKRATRNPGAGVCSIDFTLSYTIGRHFDGEIAANSLV